MRSPVRSAARASRLVKLLLAVHFTIAAPAVFAKPVKDEVSEAAASANLGKGFQAIAVLSQTPGASTVRLEGENLEVDTQRLHLAHRFARASPNGKPMASPFVELTLGRGTADETIAASEGVLGEFNLDLRYRSWSVMMGGGVSFDLGTNTQIVPMVLAGKSWLKIDSAFEGERQPEFDEFADGILKNGRIDSTVVGGGVRIQHRSIVFRDSRLYISGRYSHFFNLSNAITNPGLRPRGSSGVATAVAQIETPTRVYFGERELSAGTFIRLNKLVGAGRETLGFDGLAELGGTLILDYPVDKAFGLGLHASVVRGSGVRGYSAGLTITFAGKRII